jgi:hypothetical protein
LICSSSLVISPSGAGRVSSPATSVAEQIERRIPRIGRDESEQRKRGLHDRALLDRWQPGLAPAGRQQLPAKLTDNPAKNAGELWIDVADVCQAADRGKQRVEVEQLRQRKCPVVIGVEQPHQLFTESGIAGALQRGGKSGGLQLIERLDGGQPMRFNPPG